MRLNATEKQKEIFYNSDGGFMKTVVYVDVLVAVNILVTYIMLVCTRVVVKSDTNKWGVVLATFFGGISSLVIFWESMPLVLSVIFKMAGVIIISFSGFLPKNKKQFLKTTLAFLFVNFLFGGLLYFVELTFNPSNIFYMNGTVYFDISVLFLVSMTLICYGLLLVFDFFLRKRSSEKTLYKATIYFRDKSVTLNALYDTGNHLTDGIEGKPVVVTELNSIKDFFSRSEIEYFKSDSIVSEVPATLKSIVRIVPCSSINGSSLLKAFVTEEMIIESDTFKFKTDFFVVAVTNNALSLGEYNCLLNSDIFERGTKINEDKVFK